MIIINPLMLAKPAATEPFIGSRGSLQITEPAGAEQMRRAQRACPAARASGAHGASVPTTGAQHRSASLELLHHVELDLVSRERLAETGILIVEGLQERHV